MMIRGVVCTKSMRAREEMSEFFISVVESSSTELSSSTWVASFSCVESARQLVNSISANTNNRDLVDAVRPAFILLMTHWVVGEGQHVDSTACLLRLGFNWIFVSGIYPVLVDPLLMYNKCDVQFRIWAEFFFSVVLGHWGKEMQITEGLFLMYR